jgi:two-component system chemotaxis sensor kinase CheA
VSFSVGSFDRRRIDGAGSPKGKSGASLSPHWHISLRFTLDAFRHGVDPLTIVERLKSIADSLTIATIDDRLPRLADLQPMSCHLGFEIRLQTAATRDAIEVLLDDFRYDCIVRIFPPNRRAADFIALLESLPNEGRLGDILVEIGAISRAALDLAVEQQAASRPALDQDGQTRPIGEILRAEQKVAADVITAALERQAMIRGPLEASKFQREATSNALLQLDAEKYSALQILANEMSRLGMDARTNLLDVAQMQGAIARMSELAGLISAELQNLRSDDTLVTRQ